MRLRTLIIALMLYCPVLHAQEAAQWLLHPSVSSSTYIIETYTSQTGAFRNVPLSAIGAVWGGGSRHELAVTYDVIKGKFMGCEAVWRPSRAFGIRAGIQRMPFLLETTYSPRILEAVGFSQSASFLGGYSADLTGKNSRSRDCGISVEGALMPRDGYSVINYVAGVFNGNGYSFSDDNSAKDFQGRIVVQPAGEWKVSLGTMLAHYTAADGHLAARRRVAAGFWYDNGKWFWRSEEIFGLTDELRSNGFFILTGCRIKAGTALSVRLDRFRTDLSDSSTASTKTEACYTRMLVPSGDISLRLQYGHTFYSDPDLGGKDVLSACLIFRFGTKL